MLKTIWFCIGIWIDNIPVDAFFRSCAPWDMAAWCSSLHAARRSRIIHGCIGGRSQCSRRSKNAKACTGVEFNVLAYKRTP
jgi:hypothetical protein